MYALALLTGSCAILLSSIIMARRIGGDMRFNQDRSRALILGIYTSGALLWPAVLKYVKPDTINPTSPFAYIMHSFPALYLLINAYLTPQRHRDGIQRFEDIKQNGALLLGVIFTASMLMTNQTGTEGARNLLKLILVGSVLLVMPNPDLKRSTYDGVAVSALQNVLLSYGLGLFAVAAMS